MLSMNIPFGHRVADPDTADLRRQIYAKDKVTRAEFELALAHDGAGPDHAQLLCDIAIDLLINQADPPEYISAADANWLIAAVRARELPVMVEFQLLTQVMHYAVSTPPALSAFCLAELEKAIVLGAPDHAAGVIQPSDTEALREAVFATDEGSSQHVTRDEAEALFRIAHATARREIDPEFAGFFAKAVGNYLMGMAFHGTPSVADELQLEKFENEKPAGFGGFLQSMFNNLSMPSLQDLESIDERCDARIEAELRADAKERASSEEIDAGETTWLVAHLTRDDALTAPERALLAFLKQEVAQPTAALEALFAKAGV
jgi:hypothetical protein